MATKKPRKKLATRSKEIKSKIELARRTKEQMRGCTVWFTASSAEARIVHRHQPHFLYRLDPDVADHYKKMSSDWSVCSVILDHDIVSDRLALDIEQCVVHGKYETVMDDIYFHTQDELDKMNSKRRKNIAIFAAMGKREFSDQEIEKLISVDKEFYGAQGLKTSKDLRNESERVIKKLEELVS